MRLLPVGHDHGGGCAPQDESQAERRRHRLRHHQHLPLRHLPAGARSDPRRRQGRVREPTMTAMPKFTRRTFLISSAAVGGGLALGLRLPPFGPAVVRAADGSPEITVWVAIRPDNTTLIRAVRAEMGQGTITGLAQLIAEELDCDWSKVQSEDAAPGERVARRRAWGDFPTGALAGDALARSRILDLDLAPVAVELLGDELCEAGDRSLAHLGAHRADQGGVVRADRHPDGDLGRAVGRAHHGGTEWGKAQPERKSAADGGAADEEGTAGEFRNGCHGRLPHAALAAAWIASRTCTKVPQRQMLVIAASMSASLGLGLVLRSAATAMIMPDWQ